MVEIKITVNLTEEDGFRKLTSNSKHKNNYFYSYKYSKNENGGFFLFFFCLFTLVLIMIRRKKQEKLFRSVCLIYLQFLKTVKLLNSIAGQNITNFLFGCFEHVWPLPSKMTMPTCRNFDVYLHAKNELHP